MIRLTPNPPQYGGPRRDGHGGSDGWKSGAPGPVRTQLLTAGVRVLVKQRLSAQHSGGPRGLSRQWVDYPFKFLWWRYTEQLSRNSRCRRLDGGWLGSLLLPPKPQNIRLYAPAHGLWSHGYPSKAPVPFRVSLAEA